MDKEKIIENAQKMTAALECLNDFLGECEDGALDFSDRALGMVVFGLAMTPLPFLQKRMMAIMKSDTGNRDDRNTTRGIKISPSAEKS